MTDTEIRGLQRQYSLPEKIHLLLSFQILYKGPTVSWEPGDSLLIQQADNFQQYYHSNSYPGSDCFYCRRKHSSCQNNNQNY